ncbi:hypothetical protein [Streptomyces sp. cg35]|uniref:hypothetical protein n=1 Tax=Streptomyces sp. cg35 TaxID=3421650 RepID=UPI003D18366C
MTVTAVTPVAAPASDAPSWLRPFSTVISIAEDGGGITEATSCLKCRSTDTVVEYHSTAVAGFTCFDQIHSLRLTNDLDQEAFDQALGAEHLCRACLACHFTWCEKTADAG